MSTGTLENITHTTENKTVLTEAVYTICPVLVASHVAYQKGWLEEELTKVGGSLKYLWSLSDNHWLSHFNHTLPNQFRDGGNIPAIDARSKGQKTRLIGLTFSGDGGQILTRVNSGINKVADLKGRKIGLYKRVSTDRVDFWRGTAERGILLALDIAGLKSSDVQIEDLAVSRPDYSSTEPTQDSSERFGGAANSSHFQVELEALLAGKVDAIYANRGRSHIFQLEGKVKAIEDLGRYPDWTLQVANSPYTITVSEELATDHPEIVVAYLKAAIKAGRWIHANRAEAAEIFGNIISHWAGKGVLKEEIEKYNFIPNLSAKNIAGIEVEKRFLLEHGYIQNDFNVEEWADPRFLSEALSSF